MDHKPENPRDVLAAEEFALPAPDPRLHQDEARDVLAAEAFVMPAPDPRLRMHSQPLTLPPDPQDPAGVEPAHDVLAAEEFAMPAPLAADPGAPTARAGIPRQTVIMVLVALAGVAVRLGRRRSRAFSD
jgi:hypothetical protein